MRIGKVTVLAALTVLVLGVVTAAAHRVNYGSKVQIDSAVRATPTTGKYEGEVKSGVPRCRKGRKVKVWHDSVPPFLIGTDTTDANGKWAVDGPAPPDGDSIYAVTSRKTLRKSATHRHRCKGARSAKEVFPVD